MKYAMDLFVTNVGDFIAELLVHDAPWQGEFFCANTYQVKIEPANDGWDRVWDNVSIRWNGSDVWHNCGNRHGGRRMIAAIAWQEMLALSDIPDDGSAHDRPKPADFRALENEIYRPVKRKTT